MIELTTEPSLAEKIRTGRAQIAVIGLGYVGLPLATAFAETGHPVVGLDLDPRKVSSIREGVSYLSDLSSESLACQVEAGRLRATTDTQVLAQVDVAIICVPTPQTQTKQPDLTCIRRAGEMVAEQLHPGMLVVLESTTYPGTTEEVLRPLLERAPRGHSARAGAGGPGLVCGRDFELAYSPERVDPSNRRFGLRNTPKIVSGVTPAAMELAAALYARVTERVVPVSTPRVAEMTKLLENSFRHVNIALANEMGLLCREMGIDIWEAIEAAATKPFGFMPFYPGPGVGGHCIPVDPFYFSWKCRQHDRRAHLIELAGEINDRMPAVVVERIAQALRAGGKSLRGSHVLLVGISYKKDVGDVRESPALKVMSQLDHEGARVSYHDPHVPFHLTGKGPMASVTLDDAAIAGADCVVILTNHTGLPYDRIARRAQVVVDTRNVLREYTAANVIRL